MTVRERRERERASRRQLIIDTARQLAEDEGWGAVTSRRLADCIEYSQPVLYSHFPSMEAIVQAVAVQGFADLAEGLRAARGGADRPEERLRAVAHAYVDFGLRQRALYDAMFVRTTDLAFGSAETPEPLRRAFGELRSVVAELAGEDDAESDTEVFWAALHGLVTLARSQRLRTDAQGLHLGVLLDRFTRLWDPRTAPAG
ncbi:TetR/AcrR family transcriptional regulator [Nocardia sp. CC227C]|uniref:TetR/AcrR family transcriptional regulator n=1 Tax=Nocardia sp. CC227C TaxID=3044562 RepID=UPI00278BDAFB|nr:TetR/AcrR family transcriptional regulator [Nocardia sp. CC227C]